MVEIKEFSFVSQQDGWNIVGVCSMPDQALIGIVQLVHGMAEHKKRYLDFMKFLSEHGYLCVMHDHRGHGGSVPSYADLGYFHDAKAEYLVKDIHQITMHVKQKYPNLPFFLFGHSMGSLLVRNYCKSYDDELNALVVCGSPSHNPMAKYGGYLAKFMQVFKGDHYRSKLIQNMAFKANNKPFSKEMSPNAWICSDERIVKAYDQDSLCGFTFTLNGFENLFSLMQQVYDKRDWKMTKSLLPILFIAGSKDPCIRDESAFNQAVSFMEERGYQCVNKQLYEGKRHEILNEVGKEEVYKDVLAFFERVRNKEL